MKPKPIPCIILLLLPFLFVFRSEAQTYPKAKKSSQVDDYFGIQVSDPYRWMEKEDDPELRAWIMAENTVTQDYLEVIPWRDSVKVRMQQCFNFIRYGLPFRCGSSYFYYRQDGNLNQPILFYMRSLEYVPMGLFDVNKLSADGTTSIPLTVPSNDGKYLAFQVSEAGSDLRYIRIKESKTMKSLEEKLDGVKFSAISWWKDGFFYSRYDQGLNAMSGSVNQRHKVYYHRINTSQQSDSLVWQDELHPQRNFTTYVTPDERYLLIIGSESTSGNNVYVKDLKASGSAPLELISGFDFDFEPLGLYKDQLLFTTNYKADRYKIIRVPVMANGLAAAVDVLPEQADILLSAKICSDAIVANYMKDASSKLVVYSLTGIKKADIPLQGLGTVDGISGDPTDSMMFFSYTTYTSAPLVYRFNLKTMRMGNQFKSPITYKTDDYETKRIFYTSKDGTSIPMFITARKGYNPNGQTPVLLFGYGGFNISKTPEFKPERLVFLEKGGILAVPCIRGGGEYGSAWHKAGTVLKKQNVFDDFIAAAEYLIKSGYTQPEKLAIAGRSNGGLLVGACMTQRPDLFKVALPAVGVMDMLRFHKFTIGWAWKTDYGSSEKKEEFEALYKYSPLHNVKDGVSYPATLITTADHDDRVVPCHSYKFAATLQEKNKGSNPQLIRIETNTGHGAGKPMLMQIAEQSDIFAFLLYNLGMTW